MSVSLRVVGRQTLSETGLLPSSRTLLIAAACDSLRQLASLPVVLQMISQYCESLLVVAEGGSLLKEQLLGLSPLPTPSPLLMRLYRHAVPSRIDLGKLSTLLPSVPDLGREERGDCGAGEKCARPRPTAALELNLLVSSTTVIIQNS